MKVDQAKRLKQLEQENARLKRLVGELSVLLLQLLQALGLINLHPPIPPTPAVVALVRGTGLKTSCEHILALANLDLDLAQLGQDLLGFSSNTFWHNLILSNDKNMQFLSLKLDQLLNAGHLKIAKYSWSITSG